MGKINNYPSVSVIELEDKLIGTRVAEEPEDSTFNFTIAGLLALFQENITLQDVLNAGNTATQSIVLDGLIICNVAAPRYIQDEDDTFGFPGQVLTSSATGLLWETLPEPVIPTLQDVLNAGNTATQSIVLDGLIICNVAAPRYIQDEDDTFGFPGQVLTSSATGLLWETLPEPVIPTLQSVLDAGNTATQDIVLDGGVFATDLEVINDALISTLKVGRGGNAIIDNTALGVNVLISNTTGSGNTALGYQALQNNTTGSGNIAIGASSLQNNTTGSLNTAIGRDALISNTTGFLNTAIGSGSLLFNTTGSNNTAIGANSLLNNTTGFNNTANGRDALFSNTTGFDNTALGYQALQSNTTGDSNTANGRNALRDNTTGFDNTALGLYSLASNTTGIGNTANGVYSLFSNTTGDSNTANGRDALQNNTTGNDNTAIGANSLLNNTTESNNTAIGSNSLLNNTTGFSNTALGHNSGRFIANGLTANTNSNNSVFLGVDTTPLADNQTNQIVIGHSAIGAGSNTATLGNTSIVKTILRGTINVANLATSSAGLNVGDLWINGTVINIVT